MTTETNAVAMTMIDRLIQRDDAEAAAWSAEFAAIITDMRARADEAILALIDARIEEPLTHVLKRAARFEDEDKPARKRVTRRAIIEAEGLEAITIKAVASEPDRPGCVCEIRTSGYYGSNADTASFLSAAIIAARRAWLAAEEQRQTQEAKERAAEEQRQAQEAQRIAADDAALDAWAPAYGAYCGELAQRARHNAAIVAPLANDLSRQPFDARRLTYAIVYGDGAEATTEVTWVMGDSERAVIVEIDSRGQIEPIFYYHPVSVTPPRTYTAHEIDEALHGSARSFTGYPPIRIGTYCDGISRWRVVAAPAAEGIDATIDRAIRTSGATLYQPPAMPETPAISAAARLRTLAEEIERRHLTDDERATLRRHLIDTEIPF